MVSFEDFKKLEIKIAKIVSAEKVEGTDKLLRLEVDLGQEKKQVVAGIAQCYEAEQLINKEVPVLVNLEPRKIMGVESQGMLLVAAENDRLVLLHPDREVSPGSLIR